MRILVIGDSAREHALAYKIAQSPEVEKVYVLPGNAGTGIEFENININPKNIYDIVDFAKHGSIDLVVIGPEEPLMEGLTDELLNAGVAVFGPTKKATKLESSRAFAKDFLRKNRIPTPKYKVYDDFTELVKNLDEFGYPVLVKADGPTEGKGVYMAQNREEAEKAAKELMVDKRFGESGSKVILEEFVEGKDASILCFLDGVSIIPMNTTHDYRTLKEEDKGPITAGMGSVSPNPLFSGPEGERLMRKVFDIVLLPILEGIIKENIDYKGVLYISMIIDESERPQVLEFNVRFGDPQAEGLLVRLNSDLVQIMEACIEEQLDNTPINWNDNTSVSLVLAEEGYPEESVTGKKISGLDEVLGVKVFHDGTKVEGDDIVTDGGRVLTITATAPTIEEARKKVYEQAEKIKFDGRNYRLDIGNDLE